MISNATDEKLSSPQLLSPPGCAVENQPGSMYAFSSANKPCSVWNKTTSKNDKRYWSYWCTNGVSYCSNECLISDWKIHKTECRPITLVSGDTNDNLSTSNPQMSFPDYGGVVQPGSLELNPKGPHKVDASQTLETPHKQSPVHSGTEQLINKIQRKHGWLVAVMSEKVSQWIRLEWGIDQVRRIYR